MNEETRRAGMAPRPSWTVLPGPADLPQPPATVLAYLIDKFPRIPADIWRDRMHRGVVIERDGTPLPVETPYRPFLKVGYFRELDDEVINPLEVEILHRSEHLIVADKPPFLPVSPSGRFVEQCLIYRIEKRLGIEGVAPIHRLDRMTSGVVLLSTCKSARAAYGRLFEDHRVEKIYEAICRLSAPPNQSTWTVESIIERGEPWFRMTSRPAEEGETANSQTLVELTEERDGLGRFRLRPITGKTHQLRVHMASLGFPIFRDPLYPVLLDKRPDDFSRPMALLAKSIAFCDPLSKESVRFQSRQTLGFPLSTPTH